MSGLANPNCSVCGVLLTKENGRRRDGKDARRKGFYSACRKCWNLSHKNWSRKHYKTKIRNSFLKSWYGLDNEGYEKLLVQQGGVCAICLKPELIRKRFLSVDHDHVTKQVRGLLCSNCNVALGLFKEDTGILANAINYLK